MKRNCETCKWNIQESCINIRSTLADVEFFRAYGCSEWKPKSRGTCGDCEFGRKAAANSSVACAKNAMVWNLPDTEGYCVFTQKTPSCGDWMPEVD